ncbi:MAG: hypothetical protein ACE5JQ_15965, partial [Candidatus Methylomirabilales bacterium]
RRHGFTGLGKRALGFYATASGVMLAKRAEPMIVIAKKSGQLANRLFLFAHFIAFAEEHGVRVMNPAFDEYCRYFLSTVKDPLCRYPPGNPLVTNPRMSRITYGAIQRVLRLWERAEMKSRHMEVISIDLNGNCNMADPMFVELAKRRKLLLIRGWNFRNHDVFNKHADTIRKYFIPLEKHRNNVVSVISKAREGCDILIGVHIRQGDYAKFRNGIYLYETTRYAKLMGQVTALFEGKRVGFLVCSNAEQDRGHFPDLEVAYSTNHLVEDLYGLTGCDLIMGPPSTYSMWASFYGRVPLYIIEKANAAPTRGGFEVFEESAKYSY